MQQEAHKAEGTGAWAAFKVLLNLRQQLGTKDLISTKYHPHQLIGIISVSGGPLQLALHDQAVLE